MSWLFLPTTCVPDVVLNANACDALSDLLAAAI
uniref:Uncharacterized protein n=1 Tax=Arundo donax TaxID=35708 RepID=A0A0A8ZVU4_ARUDO